MEVEAFWSLLFLVIFLLMLIVPAALYDLLVDAKSRYDVRRLRRMAKAKRRWAEIVDGEDIG